MVVSNGWRATDGEAWVVRGLGRAVAGHAGEAWAGAGVGTVRVWLR